MSRKHLYLTVLSFIIILLDQLTKIWVLNNFTYGEVQEIIPGLFNLTLVMNPGAAFGIFASLPDTIRRIVLGAVTFIAVILVITLLRKDAKDDIYAETSLYMILGGAFGNLIDRFRFDAVVDFLDFYIKDYHWPAFNVADSAISIGVTLLLFRFIFKKEKLEE
jgi:signal peptidase II